MTTADLLSDLQARGIRLQANGDRLRVEAPTGVLTPKVRETLAARKAELLQLLAPDPSRLLAMPLDAFAAAGQMLEVHVPWWPDRLWFVPDAPAAAILTHEGMSRGRIWTAGELADLLSIPGLTKEGVQRVAEARIAFDGDVVAVRLPERGAAVPPISTADGGVS
jgi:tubulysin polyketide synthase-like protein